MPMSMSLPEPILYSFRRCPYAMRARMAIRAADIHCQLREVVLKDKPASMLNVSSKGTVPVLLDDDMVIDESLGIIRWAVSKRKPKYWCESELDHELVHDNDHEFKANLDRYKYFDRYPEFAQQVYFERCQPFLQRLEDSLVADDKERFYLHNKHLSALDVAIFPFIRQFAFVHKKAFDDLPFVKLKNWLDVMLKTQLFESIMQKHVQWQISDTELVYV